MTCSSSWARRLRAKRSWRRRLPSGSGERWCPPMLLPSTAGWTLGPQSRTLATRSRVPHHLIDVADPRERYSAGMFVRDADAAIARDPQPRPAAGGCGRNPLLRAGPAVRALPRAPQGPETAAVARGRVGGRSGGGSGAAGRARPGVGGAHRERRPPAHAAGPRGVHAGRQAHDRPVARAPARCAAAWLLDVGSQAAACGASC